MDMALHYAYLSIASVLDSQLLPRHRRKRGRIGAFVVMKPMNAAAYDYSGSQRLRVPVEKPAPGHTWAAYRL